MLIKLDIPIPSIGQNIIMVPIHYCGGHVVDAGDYGFEECKPLPKGRELSLKPVKVKNGDKGYFEAYYDPAREMIFFDWMSMEIARKLGLTIKEDNNA